MNLSLMESFYEEPDHLYWTRFHMNCYLLPVLCFVGFVVNVVAAFLLTLAAQRLRKTVRRILTTLTILDALQLFFSLAYVLNSFCDEGLLHPQTLGYRVCIAYSRYLHHFVTATTAVIDTAHVWILVALTAHRYWKVCHPFHSLIYDSGTAITKVIIGICLTAFLFRIPMFFEYTFKVQASGTRLVPSAFSRSYLYNLLYYGILQTFLFTGIPFVSLLLLNLLILRSICCNKTGGGGGGSNGSGAAEKRRNGAGRHRERRAAIGVCFIVSIFLLLHGLNVYENVQNVRFWIFDQPYTSHDKMLIDIGILLSVFSSACNPFIYIALGSTCRSLLLRTLKRTRRNGQPLFRTLFRLSSRSGTSITSLGGNNNGGATATVISQETVSLMRRSSILKIPALSGNNYSNNLFRFASDTL